MDNSIPKIESRQLFLKKAPFLPCFARRLEKLCIFNHLILFRLYNDKQTYLIIYILFLSLCGINRMHQSSMPVDRNNIREWLSLDADSCLWYYTGHYTTLLKEKRYREIEQLYASVLRAMPERPKGAKYELPDGLGTDLLL